MSAPAGTESHGGARVTSLDDPAVLDLFERLSELGSICALPDKAANVARACDCINLIFAHGMFRVGTRPAAAHVRQAVLDRTAKTMLSVLPFAAWRPSSVAGAVGFVCIMWDAAFTRRYHVQAQHASSARCRALGHTACASGSRVRTCRAPCVRLLT